LHKTIVQKPALVFIYGQVVASVQMILLKLAICLLSKSKAAAIMTTIIIVTIVEEEIGIVIIIEKEIGFMVPV
jgi:hypothetical protein